MGRRTQDVDRLLARKSTQSLGGTEAASATVNKEDGKWKVDMSYIDHRTIDTSNLTRKDAGGEGNVSFSDPTETKYAMKCSQKQRVAHPTLILQTRKNTSR